MWGPVQISSNAQIGRVYKVDTATFAKVDSVVVGYQPEEMAIKNGCLYVANSGGYRVPNYDRTVSVIDLKSFKETKKIDVAINLHRCRMDKYGQLWVTSRGDYWSIAPKLYYLHDNGNGEMVKGDSINTAVSDMCIVGDSLFYFGTAWNNNTGTNEISYGIINVRTHQIVSNSLSSSEQMKKITLPYGIIVNPLNKDFYIMDAKDYVSSGELLHFKADGTFDWRVWTGDIPAHAVFVYRKSK
jgi:DNA-binding beta-propeller fold protein YncE